VRDVKQLSFLVETPTPVSPLPVNTDPWKRYDSVTLYHGDCVEILKAMPARSVDALVSDPPYGLGFMGKAWDTFKPGEAEARIVENHAIESENPNLRGRTRGPASSPSAVDYDRTLEGQRAFQRWCEQWSREVFRVLKPGAHAVVCGAPRSAHRMICGLEDAGFEIRDAFAWLFGQGFPKSHNLTDDDGAKTGLGTALKPGHEPIVLARKPFDGTVDENVARWGVGALHIAACKLGGDRWPANVLLDDEAAAQLGAPSRFFFVAKPSQRERDFGCETLPALSAGERTDREDGSAGISPYAGARRDGGRNPHPTVKPVTLMCYLLALVAPAGGVVLDPFLGSGTTGMACAIGGYAFIGIERELKYLTAADLRIAAASER
jgi:site-specific DNA-methyltransferase (adenine-specific)